MKYEFDINEFLKLNKLTDYLAQEHFSCSRAAIDNFLKEHELRVPIGIGLEVGKFYKNREGDKCFCFLSDAAYFRISILNKEVYIWVDEMGRYSPNRTRDLDIISEWTAEDEKEWSEKQ